MWPSGWGAGLVTWWSRFHALHPVTHRICFRLPELNFVATPCPIANWSVSRQLEFFNPVFIYNFFVLALKVPFGEWSIIIVIIIITAYLIEYNLFMFIARAKLCCFLPDYSFLNYFQ